MALILRPLCGTLTDLTPYRGRPDLHVTFFETGPGEPGCAGGVPLSSIDWRLSRLVTGHAGRALQLLLIPPRNSDKQPPSECRQTQAAIK